MRRALVLAAVRKTHSTSARGGRLAAAWGAAAAPARAGGLRLQAWLSVEGETSAAPLWGGAGDNGCRMHGSGQWQSVPAAGGLPVR